MDPLNRRGVLRQLGRLSLLAGVSAVAAACGGGGGSSSTGYGGSSSSKGGGSTGGTPAPLTCSTNPAVDYTISGNHGHTACIGQGVLDGPSASNTITLTAASTDGHTHEITLTATEIAEIKAGTAAVAKTSTLTGHTHLVTYPA